MIPFKFFLIQLIDRLDQLLGHPSRRLCDLIGNSSWWDVRLWAIKQRTADGEWELRGVVVTEEQAALVCSDDNEQLNPNFAIQPVMLGEVAPRPAIEFLVPFNPSAN